MAEQLSIDRCFLAATTTLQDARRIIEGALLQGLDQTGGGPVSHPSARLGRFEGLRTC
jgi:hypothetical protein